ncbi:2-aminoadipate transaminase [Pichia kluyveri]|uniref:2-aminoadipate transaminase n=1 Tax=Pichia kluyveri TaxID=36015 RepID=A0AAV5QZ29_PICKL|nr:2-aminoadipate transaminase [Pichia kluyveri]
MSHQKVVAYNFFKGHPSVDLLPSKEILKASQKVLETFTDTLAHYDGRDNTHPLNYGPDLGNLEVRDLIAKWNDKNFNLTKPTDPNCINLTNGASFGLMNALLQCTAPFDNITKQIFMISPTYFLINSAIIDHGFAGKLTSIVEFDNGDIDFDSLEKKLEEIESKTPSTKITKETIYKIYDPNKPMKKIYNYVFYIVPTFSNPKGGSLSDSSKLRLINIARKYNMLIICDDVYDLLDFKFGKDENYNHHKRMVYLDRETLPDGEEYGNVISNGTFSKLLGPGLRTGWQETATPKLANLIASGGANMSGGTPGHFNTVIIGELIKSGEVDKIIANLNKIYSERADTLKKAVLTYLPNGTKISPVDGGYFSWITLPDEYDNIAIAKECTKRGVILATGDNFEVTGDERGWGEHGVRVSISHLTSEGILEGIKIWGEVCQSNGKSSL